MLKITSLLRIRNEELLLEDTLRSLSKFSDEVYIFSDASSDDSVKICEIFPKVKKVLQNHFHSENQSYVQTAQRKLLLDYAKADSKNKWFLSSDADDRFYFDWDKLDKYDKQKINMIYFRTVDAYLTPDDFKDYKRGDKLEDSRKWFGVETREIGLLFNREADYDLKIPACRQPQIENEKKIVAGHVLHYGKSIGIKHWNDKCLYYQKSVPQLAEKWKKRKGKAIHAGVSDFGTELITKKEIKKRLEFGNGDKLIKI